MDSAPSVDDGVTVWLPTHGSVEDDVERRATNGVSSGIGQVPSGIDSMMVVDDGAHGGTLTPPQSKSDMNTVFGKPQFSQFRRKVDSSDEDCAPDDLTYYGNRDTDSEKGSSSSLDDEIPQEIERRLPPPFSAGYDRVLMRERSACSPSEAPSFRLSTQIAPSIARKLSPDFEALTIDDKIEMAEWALQVSRTGVCEKDDSWKSTTVNRSCDTTDPLSSSFGPNSGDLFDSEESDDQPRREKPVPAPRVRKLAVPGPTMSAPRQLAVTESPVPAPRVRKLAFSESPVVAPRERRSVDRDNFRVVELQSAGRSQSIRPRKQDVTSKDQPTSDKYESRDRRTSHAEGSRSSRKHEVFKRRRSYSSDDSSIESRRSRRRAKYSGKRHHWRDSSSSPEVTYPTRRSKREPSVTFRDDSSERKSISRSHKDSIKIERYDGSTSFEAFLVQFENCSSYNGWDSDDKLLQLKGALRGPAAQLLLGEGDATTFSELCQVLRQCFGIEGCENQFESQLKMRRRYRGETLRSLYQDVHRLVLQAYPGSQNKLRDRLAVESFITSLNDKDLELRVRDRCPTNLPECFRIAMMLESNQLIVQGGDTIREKRRAVERTDMHARVIDSEGSNLRETAEFLQNTPVYHNANSATSDKGAVLDQYIQELEQRLQKLKEEKLEGSTGNSFVSAQQVVPQFSPQADRPRQPAVCFRCGRPGHMMESCRTKTCYGCGQFGHIRVSCPNRRTSGGPPRYQASLVKLAALSDEENKPDLRRHVYLDTKLNGQDQRCLLDSGCDVTLLPASCVRSCQLRPTDKKVKAANGTEIALLGEVEVILQIGHLKIPTFALVTENIAEPLIGYDWLAKNKVFWGFGVGKILIQDEIFPLIESQDETNTAYRVILQEDVTLAKFSESIIPAQIVIDGRAFSRNQQDTEELLVEPTALNGGLFIASTLLPHRCYNVPVRVVNSAARDVTLKRGSMLAEAQPVSEVHEIAKEKDSPSNTDEWLEKLMENVGNDLSYLDRANLRNLLYENRQCFSRSEYDLGQTSIVKHCINTGDSLPIRQALRRQPLAYLPEIDKQVNDMLDHGIIEPCASPWTSNVVIATKKDGSLRCCVDYRRLNSVTRKDSHPLPRITEVRAPLDLMFETPETEIVRESYDAFAEDKVTKMRESYQLVREHLGLGAERLKRYYDMRVRPSVFERGTWVYHYSPRRFIGKSPKWQRMYSGPYLVVKELGPVNVMLQQTRKSQPFVTHIDKVKACLGVTPESWLNEVNENAKEENEISGPSITDLEEIFKVTEGEDLLTTVDDMGGNDVVHDEVEVVGHEKELCAIRPRREIRRPTRLKDFCCNTVRKKLQ